MRKYSRLFIGVLVLLLLTIPVTAEDKITYDFNEEIQVEYAAEFTAVPVSEQVYGWPAEIAGGAGKPLQVLYGIVNLRVLGTLSTFQEEFVKISGENGSRRFLSNSMITGWYDEGIYSELKYKNQECVPCRSVYTVILR